MASIDTPLPASGLGYTTYNRETAGADQYGTKDTIDAIVTIGLSWWAMTLLSDAPPVQIGDISRRGGGRFPPHSTHRTGRDVDMRPFRTDLKQEPVTYKDSVYDRETTRMLARLIKTLYPKAKILFNDPEIIKDGLAKASGGHDNHLHVTFN